MKLLRWLLFPISVLYNGITSIRNYFYNVGLFKSKFYDLPVICIGNLSVGGTGKSPMTAYLVAMLKNDFKVAVLSRGYKRKTKGYIEVTTRHTAAQVGDEPLQLKKNFPTIDVAVCADRQYGIERLKTKAGIVLLDDAYQHRSVKASTYILLTPYNDLYTKDFVLPTGNLRESRKGSKRADVIIVTKCPDKLPYAKMQQIEYDLKLEIGQKLFFSKIGYDTTIYGISEKLPLNYLNNKEFTLVTGIANPEPLVTFLMNREFSFTHLKFGDHHHFTKKEIEKLKQRDIILTTEKDFMRLKDSLQKFALYYLPIKTHILRNQEEVFTKTILTEIKQYASKNQ